jgi:hypothetical protein
MKLSIIIKKDYLLLMITEIPTTMDCYSPQISPGNCQIGRKQLPLAIPVIKRYD